MASPSPSRLPVVDALRGFAIVAIMLLHNIEHFDLYHKPEGTAPWLAALDQRVWDALFFLFAGKAYAIFAVLFGVTFALQSAHAAAQGRDFRPRFAWRLVLLAGFGLLNSIFYQGDILRFYAVLGFCLLPVPHWPSRVTLTLACLLLLQPTHWNALWTGFQQPAVTPPNPASWALFGQIGKHLSGPSALAAWGSNLTLGTHAVVLWTWEAGRIAQSCALFYLGYLAATAGWFESSQENRRLWGRIFAGATAAWAVFYIGGRSLPALILGPGLRTPVENLVGTWSSFAFMGMWVSGLAWWHGSPLGGRLLSRLAPLGRMSLTAYFSQSVIGTTLYYGYGAGLYQSTGATVCLAIGLVLATGQLAFAHYWMTRHAQGPLETLWHRATWWGAKKASA